MKKFWRRTSLYKTGRPTEIQINQVTWIPKGPLLNYIERVYFILSVVYGEGLGYIKTMDCSRRLIQINNNLKDNATDCCGLSEWKESVCVLDLSFHFMIMPPTHKIFLSYLTPVLISSPESAHLGDGEQDLL